MDLREFETRLQVAAQKALFALRYQSPIDTGNLRFNAIKLKYRNGGFTLYIDLDVAPYQEELEEHTHWFENAVRYIAQIIATELQSKSIKT